MKCLDCLVYELVIDVYLIGYNIRTIKRYANVLLNTCKDIDLAVNIRKTMYLGGLGVTCSPRGSRFPGSNLTEVDGCFQDVKILSTFPPWGTLSWGSRVWDFRIVKETQAWKNRHLSNIKSVYSCPSNI